MERFDEGMPKLWLIRQALALRKQHPEWFGPQAGIEPLEVRGARRDHVIAFIRGESVVTIVPRLVAKLGGDWRDTEVELPRGEWTNHMTGDAITRWTHKTCRADAPISSCLARARRELAVNRRSVWAPSATSVAMVTANARVEMHQAVNGWWHAELSPELSRADYAFSLDGGPPLPDPRSPYQPNGVHGSVAACRSFGFRVASCATGGRRRLSSAIIYECHIGTFTPSGTFDAAVERLGHLRDLGVTHVELMPVAEFSGDARMGLRRRRSFRTASFVRRPGRDEALGRCGAWARPRRHSRRGLQSPRSGGELSREIRSLLYRSLSHAMGRRASTWTTGTVTRSGDSSATTR